MYDYVIVGGGSAGSVLAARLSEDPAVQVCLLEAGPPDDSVLIHCPGGLALMTQVKRLNWRFETVPQPGLNGRRGYQPRGRVLGGSSSINAMIYMRGHPSDYDHWAAQGNPGWAWNDVLPWFRHAEHNERGANAFHGSGGPLNVMDLRSPNPFAQAFVEAGMQAGHPHNRDFNGASMDGIGLYQVTQRDGERFSAAKAYLARNRQRPNLRIITGARATQIELDGRRAVAVHALVDGHRQRFAAAREVLLSAGALQSPQLLMLSGIGPGDHLQAHGIGVKHHLPGVGRALHDHIDVVTVHDVPGAADLFGISLAGAGRAMQAIGEWRRERRGLLTTNFAEAGGFLRSSPAAAIPDLQLHFVVAKLIDHGRRIERGHGFTCHVCVLQPHSRGRVELASADPLAAPSIDPAFLQDRRDVDTLVRGFRLMRQILQQPALTSRGAREQPGSAACSSDDQIEAFIRRHADTVYHPVGSCRMGPGEQDVVDAELRVHGLQGLRVVDASIMPRIISGNTNAPAIMIAEKAADLIRKTNPSGR